MQSSPYKLVVGMIHSLPVTGRLYVKHHDMLQLYQYPSDLRSKILFTSSSHVKSIQIMHPAPDMFLKAFKMGKPLSFLEPFCQPLRIFDSIPLIGNKSVPKTHIFEVLLFSVLLKHLF